MDGGFLRHAKKPANMQQARKSRIFRPSIVVAICFLLSGMCGLIYQVIWTRSLSLIFGHTTFAISTVITVFMGGLALGSFLLGRLADSRGTFISSLERLGSSPALFLYGSLELIIGFYCLLTPFLFKVVESLYLPHSSLPFFHLSILRCILCICVLIVPTFCMGGTLPLLSKFLITRESELARKLGFLYFINTLGAVCGTLLSGFFLIRSCGVSATLQAAAVINIGIGLFIYFFNRGLKTDTQEYADREEDTAQQKDEKNGSSLLSPQHEIILLTIFAFTGFASMIYELAWTRALALALGSSTYSFSTMLATFLFGIAIGSVLFGILSSRINFGFSTFGWIEAGVGVTSILCIMLLGQLPLLFIRIFPLVEHSYSSIIAADFLLSFLIMLLPTILMGFAFPLVGKLCTKKVDILGKSVGDVYAINTVGCIAGSFITGFIMIPGIGVQNSLKCAVLINLIGGFIILLVTSRDIIRKALYLALIVAGIFASNLIPEWNPAIMSSGSAIYAPFYQKGIADFDAYRRDYVKYQKDGISATVSVYKIDNIIYLRVNGKTDASTGGDMITQLLLGYLTCFYSREPLDVYIIGMGSGMTARAVLDFPSVKSVECAEIEPTVIEANQFFSDYNEHILKDPRFKVTVADGRNGLLSARRKFDVIISEPSNIWISGVSDLFTLEFYSISASRLKEGGIMCSWVHVYNMKPADLKMILRTFTTVFPYCKIWQGSPGDILLFGSSTPFKFDYSRYSEYFSRNEKIKKRLQAIDIATPDVLLAQYITDEKQILPLCSTAFTNSDGFPILEFSAPESLYMDTVLLNLKGLFGFEKELIPEMERPGDQIKLSPHFYRKVTESLKEINAPLSENALETGLSRYPDSVELNNIRLERLLKSQQIMKSEEILTSMIAGNPEDDALLLRLGELYENQGMKKKAEVCYEKAYQINKKELKNIIKMSWVLSERGDFDKALIMMKESEQYHKDSEQLSLLYADLLVKTKQGDQALGVLEKMAGKNPNNMDVQRRLLLLYENKKDYGAFMKCAGRLYAATPGDNHVRALFAKALIYQGRSSDAAGVILAGLEQNPFDIELVELYYSLVPKQ